MATKISGSDILSVHLVNEQYKRTTRHWKKNHEKTIATHCFLAGVFSSGCSINLFFKYNPFQFLSTSWYVTLEKIGKVGLQKKGLIYSTIALLVALSLYRGLVVYIIDPIINQRVNTLPFFYPLGFLVALMDVGFASGAAIAVKQLRLQLIGKEKEKNLIRESWNFQNYCVLCCMKQGTI